MMRGLCVFIVLFALIQCGIYVSYIQRPLVQGSLRELDKLKYNPYFTKSLWGVGRLPSKQNKSSYLNHKKTHGKIVVGCFGDSHTAGSEVGLDLDFPSQLQKILGNDYQVINLARGGFNSNQIYLMMNFFVSYFNIDIVVLGPRGFYSERAQSFNPYWPDRGIPSSRFDLDEEGLFEIAIPGRSLDEKIINYYSIIPTYNSLFHSIELPSILKNYYLYFTKDMANPFSSYSKSLTSVDKVQRAQILEVLNRYPRTKIIHYSDYKIDREKFSNLNHPRYFYRYTDFDMKNFPFKAKISHPSTLGQRQHALNVASLIKKEKSQLLKMRGDIPTQALSVSVDDKNLKDYRHLSVYINNIKYAAITAHSYNLNRAGKIFNDNIALNGGDDHALIGLWDRSKSKFNSLFFEVPHQKMVTTNLPEAKIHRVKGFHNVYLIEMKNSLFKKNGRDLIYRDGKDLSEITVNGTTLYHKVAKNYYRNSKLVFHFVTNSEIDPDTILKGTKNYVGTMELRSN